MLHWGFEQAPCYPGMALTLEPPARLSPDVHVFWHGYSLVVEAADSVGIAEDAWTITVPTEVEVVEQDGLTVRKGRWFIRAKGWSRELP